ncbi:hypothetical protein KQX54_002491 [Cotesia glomerata]|uniref:Uncharacterized protein n=1 Tax=Cotesia glomerata TaxID=32391 RepID=A0AAV7IJH8_COTGL|nr:hypothetical protein KQX54_002491 [Cotesia glomerata]
MDETVELCKSKASFRLRTGKNELKRRKEKKGRKGHTWICFEASPITRTDNPLEDPSTYRATSDEHPPSISMQIDTSSTRMLLLLLLLLLVIPDRDAKDRNWSASIGQPLQFPVSQRTSRSSRVLNSHKFLYLPDLNPQTASESKYAQFRLQNGQKKCKPHFNLLNIFHNSTLTQFGHLNGHMPI